MTWGFAVSAQIIDEGVPKVGGHAKYGVDLESPTVARRSTSRNVQPHPGTDEAHNLRLVRLLKEPNAATCLKRKRTSERGFYGGVRICSGQHTSAG